MPRNLPERDAGDVTGGLPERSPDIRRHAGRLLAHLLRRDLERRLHAVELSSEPEKRAIASRAHIVDDGVDPPVERAIVAAAACEQALERGTIGGGYDAHHNTILFNGYSTMPWARAALSLGIRSRTVRSSMIVLTATHSSSLSEEIVGR